jgi:hypothetical protein
VESSIIKRITPKASIAIKIQIVMMIKDPFRLKAKQTKEQDSSKDLNFSIRIVQIIQIDLLNFSKMIKMIQ